MSIHTRSQKLAQAAYPCVVVRIPPGTDPKSFTKLQKEYRTFAKKSPSLIHTCGLAQAVAFAEAKGHTDFLDDLATVLRAVGHSTITTCVELSTKSRSLALVPYMRLSRDAIHAASWLKRYVEAVAGEDE